MVSTLINFSNIDKIACTVHHPGFTQFSVYGIFRHQITGAVLMLKCLTIYKMKTKHFCANDLDKFKSDSHYSEPFYKLSCPFLFSWG